ncbi:hypothetical protein DFJ67_7903 [Asanoa ferruginea]|uniref:Uncharacterized protein n=1 Tax=Asanoa ferruginea TaxID=53367 RepID=A0A3E0A089_9ACTN|nr:hypothetical protein [Asanoa ferruginea]REG01814.1 hypothetical protein DFJ67_7903 [Asanoa ferruginea]GIF49152.1 hypothetical protein Afe04nite_36910 [Asanoa ferruginea]
MGQNDTADEPEEPNEPNEFGFAGAGTGPEPNLAPEDKAAEEGDEIAVPAGDITGAIVSAIEGDREAGDDDENG